MRKPAFCIRENKCAVQLIVAFVFATWIVQFFYMYFLNPKIQAILPPIVAVQSSLCLTWSEIVTHLINFQLTKHMDMSNSDDELLIAISNETKEDSEQTGDDTTFKETGENKVSQGRDKYNRAKYVSHES